MKNKKNNAGQNATYSATVIDEATGQEMQVEKVSEVMANVTIEPAKGNGVHLGRPVNPNSARQQKLKLMEAKKIGGVYIPLGRPVVEGSARQLRLKELAEKKAAGIVGERGRPKMTDEQKATAKAEREALKAKLGIV
jgi:hypothetical protein